MQVVSPEDAYKVHRKLEEAAIIVMGVKEPHITVTITLTSPIMREQLLTPEASGGKETKKSPQRHCRYHRDSEPGAHWKVVRHEGLLACVPLAILCCPNTDFSKKQIKVISPIERLKLVMFVMKCCNDYKESDIAAPGMIFSKHASLVHELLV